MSRAHEHQRRKIVALGLGCIGPCAQKLAAEKSTQ